MAIINIKGLQKELAKKYSAQFSKTMKKKIMADVEQAKKQMLAEFDAHEVTKDIEAGPGASTIDGGGSLFSLIGFDASARPINLLRMLLLKSVSVRLSGISRGEVSFSITINIPSKEEMDAASPLPWAGGRSWIDEVERGVSGLGQYLVKKTPASRSGTAIQVDSTVRQSSMGGRPYMKQIISNLIKNLTKNLESK